MELDRANRYLEVSICLFWIAVFYLRMRSLRRGGDGASFVSRLRSALRPIQLGALTVLVVSAWLWTQADWQALAHALSVPSLFALGVSHALLTVEGRRPAHDGVASSGT